MRQLSLLVALPAVLLIAGCGGSAGSTGGTGAASGGGTPVSIDVQDFAFSPATITAKSGDKVSVTVTNKGGYEHNFSISELGVSQDIEKGETRTVTFTVSGSTNLQFFCKYHKSRGMVGTLDLGSGAAPSGGMSPAPAGSTAPNYGSTY